MIGISGFAFEKELIRKGIHLAIAFVPTLARWNFTLTVAVLSLGIILYVVNETARIRGRSDGVISFITEIASRPTELGFIWGPVTLGLGTLAALIYYPEPVATIAIYALAFGDGVASLARASPVNMKLGGKPPLGFSLCFLTVFASAYIVLDNPCFALISAAIATGLESIPLQDLDNLIIPLGTGFVLTLVM